MRVFMHFCASRRAAAFLDAHFAGFLRIPACSSSYIRKAALGKMEYLPVNIGMVVKGLEYR